MARGRRLFRGGQFRDFAEVDRDGPRPFFLYSYAELLVMILGLHLINGPRAELYFPFQTLESRKFFIEEYGKKYDHM